MPTFLKKIILIILSAAALGYVIYYTPPPNSWEEASLLQIISFFVPIIVLATCLADLFLKNIVRSLFIGLGAVFLIILESTELLNIVTLTILLLCLGLLFYFFDTPIDIFKPKEKEKIIKKLTTEPEIPKLIQLQRKRRHRRRRGR